MCKDMDRGSIPLRIKRTEPVVVRWDIAPSTYRIFVDRLEIKREGLAMWFVVNGKNQEYHRRRHCDGHHLRSVCGHRDHRKKRINSQKWSLSVWESIEVESDRAAERETICDRVRCGVVLPISFVATGGSNTASTAMQCCDIWRGRVKERGLHLRVLVEHRDRVSVLNVTWWRSVKFTSKEFKIIFGK